MAHQKKTRKPASKLKAKKENPLDKIKWEIAEELGLADKVRKMGWGGLSAAESGRIGGLMNRVLKKPRSFKN
ncbi:MAG: small, acid-soluble spore protein, alpha/beta type [Bacillota bacterium]